MSNDRLPWFRGYADMVDNAKLRLVAFEDRWHFVALLCCKAQGVLDAVGPDDDPLLLLDLLSVKLGLSHNGGDPESALLRMKARLVRVKLIDEHWQPLRWEERQFKSDHGDPTAAERMRRYRRRLRGEPAEDDADEPDDALRPVTRNVTVLEQNRTEQIQNREEGEEGSLTLAPPPSADSKPSSRATRLPRPYPMADEHRRIAAAEGIADADREFMRFCNHWWAASGAGARKCDWLATWANWCMRAADDKGRGGKAQTGARPLSRADQIRQSQRERDRAQQR